MFKPTYYLVAPNERKTEVCLEKTSNPGWYGVRTALDWFSGSSIIQYHKDKGLISNDMPLKGYSLIPLSVKSPSLPRTNKSNRKSKGKKVKQAKTFVAQDSTPVENRAYSGRQLMKRFQCGDRFLRIKRSQPDCADWSKQRDLEGIIWKYQDDCFLPQLG